MIPVTFISIYDNILAQNKNMCKAGGLRGIGHRAHARLGKDDVLLQLLEGLGEHEGTTGDGTHIAASGPQEAQRSLDESGVQDVLCVRVGVLEILLRSFTSIPSQSLQQPLHFRIRGLVKDGVESAHGPEEARGAQADHPVGLLAQLLDGVGRAHGDGQDEVL